MISKELLSVVLNKKVIVDDISSIELKESTITFIEDYWDEDEGSGFYRSHTINIYELSNLCKIWAFVNGYELLSGTISEDNGDMIFECSIYDKNADTSDTYFITEFEDQNEPEAIFKACEWLLEQNKEKNND